MTFLIVLGCVAAWFVFGTLFAPRSAAFGYKESGYYPEDAARMWYWWTIFIGPLIAIMWGVFFTARRIYRPAHANGEDRVKLALVKYDKGYRERYLNELEAKNARLERENARLTDKVLR